jgi:hypothetical protein
MWGTMLFQGASAVAGNYQKLRTQRFLYLPEAEFVSTPLTSLKSHCISKYFCLPNYLNTEKAGEASATYNSHFYTCITPLPTHSFFRLMDSLNVAFLITLNAFKD